MSIEDCSSILINQILEESISKIKKLNINEEETKTAIVLSRLLLTTFPVRILSTALVSLMSFSR